MKWLLTFVPALALVLWAAVGQNGSAPRVAGREVLPEAGRPAQPTCEWRYEQPSPRTISWTYWCDGEQVEFSTNGGYNWVRAVIIDLPEAPVARVSRVMDGKSTHYGESYEGGWLGCGLFRNEAGDNLYHTGDATIVATRDFDYRCGQRFRITGPAGTITAFRQDSCPGCAGPWHLDLSEAGNASVCGYPPRTCNITIEVLDY